VIRAAHIALAALLAATPALAEQPPVCQEADGEFVWWAIEAAPGVIQHSWQTPDDGGEAWTHCASGVSLRVHEGGDDTFDRARATFREAIAGDDPVSMRQITAAMKRAGLKASYVRGVQTCACDPQTPVLRP